MIGTPKVGALVKAGTESSTSAVPYPANVQVNDFLMISVAARTGGTADIAYSAAGWTTEFAQSGSNSRQSVLWKRATSADVGVSTVTVTGDPVLRSLKMIAIPGVSLTNPVAGITRHQNANTAQPIMPSINAPVAGCMPVWFVGGFLGPGRTFTAAGTEWMDTWHEAPTPTTVGRAGAAYYQEPLANAGATGTREATPSLASTTVGIYILLAPEPDAPTAPVWNEYVNGTENVITLEGEFNGTNVVPLTIGEIT